MTHRRGARALIGQTARTLVTHRSLTADLLRTSGHSHRRARRVRGTPGISMNNTPVGCAGASSSNRGPLMLLVLSAPARTVDGGRPRPGVAVLLRLVLAASSGLLLVAAFPRYSLWFVAPVAMAGLAGAVRGVRPRIGAAAGLIFGLALFVPSLQWSGVYVGPVPWLALAGAEAGFVAAFGALASLASRLPGWPLWFAALWVGDEAARSRVPLGGFPWTRLAFSQTNGPTVWLAAWGGAPAVSFAVALAGGLFAAAATRFWRTARPGGAAYRWRSLWSAIAVTATAAVVITAPAGARWTAPRSQQAPQSRQKAAAAMRVALVQGNIKRAGLVRDSPQEVLNNHLAATDALLARVRGGTAPRPDLIVWPEDASDLDPLAEPAVAARISALVDSAGIPLVVGAILQGPGPNHRRNAMIVWLPHRGPLPGPLGLYVKQKPVPFGEYIPFRAIARQVTSAVDLVPIDMVAGNRTGLLAAGGTLIGPAICFEVAFDSVLRDSVRAGARLLLVPTNNSTFGRTDESVQQLAMSRLRAIEHDRAVLHVSTVGVSAVIEPDGHELGRTQLFTRDVVEAEVPLIGALTPADRIRAAPELGLSLLGLLAAGCGRLCPRFRRRNDGVHSDRTSG